MSVNKILVNNNDSNYTHSIFDISEYTGISYNTLSDALNAIPQAKQKGGMTIRYVQTDNKYVQARCMAQSFTTDVTQWQGVTESGPDFNNPDATKRTEIPTVGAILDGTITAPKILFPSDPLGYNNCISEFFFVENAILNVNKISAKKYDNVIYIKGYDENNVLLWTGQLGISSKNNRVVYKINCNQSNTSSITSGSPLCYILFKDITAYRNSTDYSYNDYYVNIDAVSKLSRNTIISAFLYLEENKIQTVDISDGAVTVDKMASNSVTTPKIANKSVTDDKLENPVSFTVNANTGQIDLSVGENTATIKDSKVLYNTDPLNYNSYISEIYIIDKVVNNVEKISARKYDTTF